MWLWMEYLLVPVLVLSNLFWLWPIKFFACLQRQKCCAPVQDKTLLISAKVLREQIAKQEITCKEAITSYIKRIKLVNESLNAVVEDRFEEALKEAESLDQMIKTSSENYEQLLQRYPLLGIPLTVKESIWVKNMSNTAGCYNAKGRRATSDAEVIDKCKKAGAIILAVTNTPELCLNWETTNYLKGRTKNPFDLRASSGGSSGGEAALLGSGASLVGIGSDIAGSLRLPAHFCGVFSHKPSAHIVSSLGHYPDCPHLDVWNSNFTLGPMARYASDLKLFLNVLIKPEYSYVVNSEMDFSKIKIYYMKNIPSILCPKLDGSISRAFDELLEQLKLKYRLDVQKFDTNIFKGSLHTFALSLLQIKDVDTVFGEKPTPNLFVLLIKKLFGMVKVNFSSILYLVLHKLTISLPKGTLEEAMDDLKERRKQLEDLLGDNGVLLMPTNPRVFYYHGTALPSALSTLNTFSLNAFGLPATNCPIGRDSKGHPFGLQVVGKRNNDSVTLQVAEKIEELRGGWISPQSKQ